MVKKINREELGQDQPSQSMRSHRKDAYHPTIQHLLQDWLPGKSDGGYAGFLRKYQLESALTREQIEQLFIDPSTYMGRNLAGVIAAIIPSEISDPQRIKNMAARARKIRSKTREIEITQEAAEDYLLSIARKQQLAFNQLLRFYREAALLSQEELAKKVNMPRPTLLSYEQGTNVPDSHAIHTLCDVLPCNAEARILWLDTARQGALEKLESSEENIPTQALIDITGGGSLFGMLLFNLRRAKGMTQDDIAERTGIARTTISHYELGQTPDNAEIVHRLADALEVDHNLRRVLLDAASNGIISTSQDEQEVLKAISDGANRYDFLLDQLLASKGYTRRDLRTDGRLADVVRDSNNHKDTATIHRLCDALDAGIDMRWALLDAATPGAFARLEIDDDTKTARKGLAGIAGGGSMFGMLLYHLRHDKGWTSETLAQKANLRNAVSIADYESGKTTPEVAIVHRLADALEVDKNMNTRFLMLDAAGRNASAMLESDDPKTIRKGLAGLVGGGSIFGTFLYHLRNERKMPQKKAASLVGVTKSNVSAYEQGKHGVSSETADEFAEALDAPKHTQELMRKAAENFSGNSLHKR